jgi:DNA-binding XRE family transcriptional regulator
VTSKNVNFSHVFEKQSIINRLKEACGVTSDRELAKELGIKRQSIGAARKRNKIPPGWIVDIGKKFNAPLDWLFHGDLPPIYAKVVTKKQEASKNSSNENSDIKSRDAVDLELEKGSPTDNMETITTTHGPSTNQIDLTLLSAVIVAFEEYSLRNDLFFKPQRKAQIICGLYEHFFIMDRGFEVQVFEKLMGLIEQ